jgi:hypothetical protein
LDIEDEMLREDVDFVQHSCRALCDEDNPHLSPLPFSKGRRGRNLRAKAALLVTGEDVEADLKVLRDARKTFHHVYDMKKKLVKVPDHKTKLAAITLSRAYYEGKPCPEINQRPRQPERHERAASKTSDIASLSRFVECDECATKFP